MRIKLSVGKQTLRVLSNMLYFRNILVTLQNLHTLLNMIHLASTMGRQYGTACNANCETIVKTRKNCINQMLGRDDCGKNS